MSTVRGECESGLSASLLSIALRTFSLSSLGIWYLHEANFGILFALSQSQSADF